LSEGLNSTCPSAQLTGPVLLPSPVVAGFLVLVENVAHDPKDPTNWSDALVFNNLQHAPLVGECDAYATFVSSCPGSGGTVVGVTDADLASVGVTTRDILNGNTLYLLESTTSTLNTYGAGLNVYYLYSDLPTPTPTQRKTWGRLKAWYR
jgi:hypothetical protein